MIVWLYDQYYIVEGSWISVNGYSDERQALNAKDYLRRSMRLMTPQEKDIVKEQSVQDQEA